MEVGVFCCIREVICLGLLCCPCSDRTEEAGQGSRTSGAQEQSGRGV